MKPQGKKVCILTGDESEDIMEIIIDGNIYYVCAKMADEYSLKKLKEMIQQKLEENKTNKTKILTKIDEMAAEYNMTKEELIKMLGGKTEATVVKEPHKQDKIEKDNGLEFKNVDGSLKSEIRANINAEEGIAYGDPAYSIVKDKDGNQVNESNKKVAKIDNNMIIEKSDMGVTTLSIVHQNSKNINELITAVDENNNLIRANITGKGNKARDCPMCRGTGITFNKVCPKCSGKGFIIL